MKYRKGYKYQLAADEYIPTSIYPDKEIKTEFITLRTDGMLILKSGYACDGPSGTTIDTPSSMTPAFGHDAFYQLMRMGLLSLRYRAKVDRMFYGWLIACRMWAWRAKIWYRAVRGFASNAADPKSEKKVYTSPSITVKVE